MEQPAPRDETVGLIGYGRFGRAQGRLLEEAGISFVAFDPHVLVDDEHRVASLSELADRAKTLFIAVPVPNIESTLQALRPHLLTHHVVADVGSVKVRTSHAMRAVLGGDIPWVGTHPLFGPISLASGERPRRVVICPEPGHTAAAESVRALYERMGCEVVLQTPEQHDRVMAHTHALTFFVAKGMIDSGAGIDVPFAPPSFQAFARTIETVRSDAGHLFAAIARENPFANEARSGLLAALVRIDQALETSKDPLEIAPRAEGAHVSPSPSKELTEARAQIDRIDREIVELLFRRVAAVKHAAKAKAEVGLPVLDAEREASVFRDRRDWAEEHSLDADSVEEVFRAIVTMARRSQRGPSST